MTELEQNICCWASYGKKRDLPIRSCSSQVLRLKRRVRLSSNYSLKSNHKDSLLCHQKKTRLLHIASMRPLIKENFSVSFLTSLFLGILNATRLSSHTHVSFMKRACSQNRAKHRGFWFRLSRLIEQTYNPAEGERV
jgi:hypothetical protein